MGAGTFVKRVFATSPGSITPRGGTTGALCDTYYLYEPSTYNAANPTALIISYHGSGEAWNGQAGDYTGTPISGAGSGNKGQQLSLAGSAGFAEIINKMLGRATQVTVATPWAEGDWNFIIACPQFGNLATWAAASSFERAAWARACVVLTDAVIADVAVQGYNVDSNKIILAGVSAGAFAVNAVALNDVINGTGTKFCAIYGGASTSDIRCINEITGLTETIAQCHARVGAALKNIPRLLSAGQGDASVAVDSAFSSTGNSRDQIAAAVDPANIGNTYPTAAYIEYDRQGSDTAHNFNYTWPLYTTRVKKWFENVGKNRPTPNHQKYKTVTLATVPHVSGDVAASVPYEVTISDTTLKSTANSGLMDANGYAWGVYTDTSFTKRIPALLVSQDLTTSGSLKLVIGIPPNSGLNVGLSVVVAWGATNVTWDQSAVDGWQAYPYWIRRALDFGNGATVSVTNQAQTCYPDRVGTATTGDTITLTGSPAATASPVGGAIVTKSTGKYAAAARTTWWGVKTNLRPGDTTQSGAAIPYSLCVLFRPNGAVASTQTLMASQNHGSTAPALALQMGASSALQMIHNTTTVVQAATVTAGWNFAAARLRGFSSRDLILNPDAGTATTTDTTTVDLSTIALSASENDIGHRNPVTNQTEIANGDIAKELATAFIDPPTDWFTALSWSYRGVGVSYTLGATQSTGGGGTTTADARTTRRRRFLAAA